MKVQDLTFNPQCSPETLEKGKEFLVKNRKQFGSVVGFSVMAEKTEVHYLNAPCHGNMQSPTNPTDRACIATEISCRRNWDTVQRYSKRAHNRTIDLPDESIIVPFVRWLTQESIFSRFILSRDDPSFAENYGIVVSSDIPSPLLQNILMMSRAPNECSVQAFELFNLIVDAGYPPEIAYTFGMNSTVSSWSSQKEPTKYKQSLEMGDTVFSYASHRPWGLWWTLGSLKNFLSGEFGPTLTDDSLLHYRNHATIYGGAAYCQENKRTGYFLNELAEKDEEYREGLRSIRKGVKLQIKNPFKSTNVFDQQKQPTDVTVEELLNYSLPYLKQKGYFDVSSEDKTFEQAPKLQASLKVPVNG